MSGDWDDEPVIDMDDEPPERTRRRRGHRPALGQRLPEPQQEPAGGGPMEEIAGKGMDFVRGMGKDHGPVVALLFVTLAMVFLLLFALGWFVGKPLATAIENNSASTKAMMAVVDQMESQCRAPRWAPPPQQWPQQQQWPQPSQQPGYRNEPQQTPR